MQKVNQIAVKHITIDRITDRESLRVFTEYIWNGEHKTDNGQLFINTNSYYPDLDMDENEEEHYALQEAVENR